MCVPLGWPTHRLSAGREGYVDRLCYRAMGNHDPGVLNVFEACDSNVVSDALDEYQATGGGIITGLAPAHPEHTAVGIARPLVFDRVFGAEPTNFPYAMLDCIADGEVFVIDGGDDPEVSCWGSLASRLAAAGGLNGVVVNGGYRDAGDIRDGSFPVFGATKTPRTGQRRMRVVSTDEPATIDGVQVAPGDIVVGDATGIAVVAAADAERVAAIAADILDEEETIESDIDAGATVADLKQDDREF